MSKLGELLKGLRGKESLRDASERIGISHTYLDTIEKGFDKRSGKYVNPTPETLKLISKGYGCDYAQLMKLAGYLELEITNPLSDLAITLKTIHRQLSNGNEPVIYNGEYLSENSKEILASTLELAIRQMATLNKNNFD